MRSTMHAIRLKPKLCTTCRKKKKITTKLLSTKDSYNSKWLRSKYNFVSVVFKVFQLNLAT